MKYFFLSLIVLTTNIVYANNLSIDFKTKDFAAKGNFTFKPGSQIKIVSVDDAGSPCELVIDSKIQKADVIEFQYKLERNGKMTDGGTIITQRGKIAKLESGPKGQKPTVEFEAHWAE